MTKDEICRRGQKYCTVPMKDDHFRGRDHGHGWESIKSLENYKLIERDRQNKSYSTGFKGQKDAQLLHFGTQRPGWRPC